MKMQKTQEPLTKEAIQQKIWNIEIIVEEIKEVPQTYKTILKSLYFDMTSQVLLRRKLNKLCSDGIICKTSIPGTRYGQSIFFYIPKKYHIMIESTRTGSDVYYFFDYIKEGKLHVVVNECWKLEGSEWVKTKEKKFFEGSVLKWI